MDNASYQPAAAPDKKESQRTEPAKAAPSRPTKIYLRVPSMTDEKAKKAANLVGIFEAEQPGYSLAVHFYDSEKKAYSAYEKRLDATDFVIRELKTLLGDENVVVH